MHRYYKNLITRLTEQLCAMLAPIGLTLLTVLLVSACGPSGSGGGGGGGGGARAAGCNLTLDELNDLGSAPRACLALLPDPVSTLSPRLFILGSETTPDGKLHIYAHGVDAAGDPIQLGDFQTQTVVTVDGTVLLDNGVEMNGGGVAVQAIADGSPISLAFLTDYSASISAANLNQIGQAYSAVLNALPPGFEAKVLNFSDLTDVRQDWTQDRQALLDAVQFDPAFAQNNTAFYDGIGNTLDRLVDQPGGGFGLADRCRPARILVAHTDGLENASFTYSKNDLLTEIDASRTIAVMLGTLTANVTELEQFAGSRGAFVYAYDVNGIQTAVSGWAGSFGNIVEFVINDGSFNVAFPGMVQIDLGALSATVEAPYDLACIPEP